MQDIKYKMEVCLHAEWFQFSPYILSVQEKLSNDDSIFFVLLVLNTKMEV